MKKIFICLLFISLICISVVYAEDNTMPKDTDTPVQIDFIPSEPIRDGNNAYKYYFSENDIHVYSDVPIEFNKEININGTTYYTTSGPIHDKNNNSIAVLDNASDKYFFYYPETGELLPTKVGIMNPTWYVFWHDKDPLEYSTIPSPSESNNQSNSTDSNNASDSMDNSSDIQQNDTNSSSPVGDSQNSKPVSIVNNSTGIPIAILLLVLGVIGINLIKKD